MAHDPINFITNIDQKMSTNRLARFVKRSTSIVFKGLKAKRSERPSSTAGIVIIESPAERVSDKNVKVSGNSVISTPTTDTHAARAVYDLSDDLAVLAAQNKAFKEGLLHLQALNLDEDLFIEAVQALRVKYYGRRNPIVSRYLPPQDAISDGESN